MLIQNRKFPAPRGAMLASEIAAAVVLGLRWTSRAVRRQLTKAAGQLFVLRRGA